MPIIYRKYGNIAQITEIEKTPSKVRLYHSRKRNAVFGYRESDMVRRKYVRHGPKRSDNIRRASQVCVRRVLSALEDFGCPLLVTCTFEGDASDAAFANDSLRHFQVRLRNAFPLAQSIFIPELSPRGRIHFHGLLFNVPLSLGDTSIGGRILSHGEERTTRQLATLWGAGYVDAKKTNGSPALGYYIAKYITKDAGNLLFSPMRTIRISHGFPKELVIRGKLAEELARRYANKQPIKEWERDNIFLGKITRKEYEISP